MSREHDESAAPNPAQAEVGETPPGIQEARDGFAAGIGRPAPDGVATRRLVLGGRPALELTPDGATGDERMLYFHGGGYVIGSSDTHAGLAGELARRAGIRTVSVDYRLAPENKFPAAVEDGLAAYRELLDSGVDPLDLVVAGDSAGGGLAVATLLAAKIAGLPQPAGLMVMSPWVDMTVSGASMQTKRDADLIFTEADFLSYADLYVGAGDRSQPLASPLFGDLTGLPPLLIQVGGDELLLDDAVRLAGRAGTDNLNVTLEIEAGLLHVFQHHFGRREEADAALERAARFLVAKLREARAVDAEEPVGAAH